MTRTIAIALFDGAGELDVAGPWEILGHWHEDAPPLEVLTYAGGQGTGAGKTRRGI